jgi:geranylgeranyl reductase family protein
MITLPNEIDILIIGGGPAGLSAGLAAAKSGFETLIIDKKREIGVPIQCGEFMPSPKEIPNILPEATHTRLLENYPKDIVICETKDIIIYSANGKKYVIPFDGYVIDREKFDKWIARLALRAGAKLSLSTTALEIKDSVVTVSTRGKKINVSTKVVIVASGTLTPLLDGFPIKPKFSEYDYSHVYQWVLGGIEVDTTVVEMYSGTRYAPGTYAWIIPRGDDMANVGLGVREPFNKDGVSIGEYLHRFMHEHPIASNRLKSGSPLSIVGGLVPAAPPLETAVYNNILVVGDAANMAMASIGAGVPTAIISGELAGISAVKYLENESPLAEFDELWQKEIGETLKNGYRIRVMMDPVLKRDDFINLALDILGEKMLYDIIRGRIPKILDVLYPIAASIMK